MGDKDIRSEEQLEKVMSDPNLMKESLSKVIGETMQEKLSTKIRDEVEAAFERHSNKSSSGRLPMGSAYGKKAPGSELNGHFKSLGEFLRVAHLERGNWTANAGLKAMNESAGAEGGFLVPEEFSARLMMLPIQEGRIRAGATILPMPRGNIKFPVVRDVSHVSSVFGGVVARWEDEGGDISENASEPTFSQVGLVAKKLTGYTVAGNELLHDSAIALEALLMSIFPEAIRYFEEEAFINGNGAGQPHGIANAACRVTVSAESGQTSGVLYDNIVAMYSRMIPSSVNRAFWLYNPEVFPELAKMSLAVGTGGSAVWISNAVGGPPTSIMGRPAYASEHCAALNTEGDLIFVDPTYYVIGDTQELSVASSPHVNFKNDQIVWRFIERLDGRPWLDSPLTPKYGNNTVSPIVTLASRS